MQKGGKNMNTERQENPNRIEIGIVHQNGRTMVKGPGNPLIMMLVLGDALNVIAKQAMQVAADAGKSALIQPGNMTVVDKRVIEAAQKQVQGK
jgi:hypothetical protein